ncbi:hypothetical protein MSAN_00608200 [Mycena sanguinolenta]|uniref:Uncharacterized protein n=1 Tax=Mycena sanguinolenta TaxID=230812 RepID=A0A8H6ZAR6_9AGAR|nr:hypothetical protein MSAN_00608200 [Mycena sanguinolenta]
MDQLHNTWKSCFLHPRVRYIELTKDPRTSSERFSPFGDPVEWSENHSSSLPERPNRVQNPGKPDAPKVYRSHEEVEADRKQKLKEAEEARQKYEAAVARAAAAQAALQGTVEAEERDAVLSLQDLPEYRPEPSFADGSDSERVDDDEAYLSAGEFDKPKKVPAAPKKSKKREKGATRAAVDELVRKKEVAAGKKKSAAVTNSRHVTLNNAVLPAMPPQHPSMQDCRWAVRSNGPGFWRIPAPENSPQDPKATGYIKPDDYLESPFIIKVLLLILRKEEFILPTELDPVTNKYDFSNMPSGLLAMAAAGVERALRLYIETGVRPEKLPKFSKSSSGTSVTSYLKNIRRFTRSRWECMLAACGAQTYMAPSSTPFAFDAYRDFIYTPSSP